MVQLIYFYKSKQNIFLFWYGATGGEKGRKKRVNFINENEALKMIMDE